MKQVEIFSTSVQETDEAARITGLLLMHFPHYQINFDLDDCDRVLRVESKENGVIINKAMVIQMLAMQGYHCCLI